jgi:hypothetical protein
VKILQYVRLTTVDEQSSTRLRIRFAETDRERQNHLLGIDWNPSRQAQRAVSGDGSVSSCVFDDSSQFRCTARGSP